MTYVCWTSCENGFRHFTDLHGVAMSYDPHFIACVVKERGEHVDLAKKQQQDNEVRMREAKEQTGQIPPVFDAIMEHNRKTLIEQMTFQKRLSTAEAVLNGDVVRNVMFFEDLDKAIEYSRGAS